MFNSKSFTLYCRKRELHYKRCLCRLGVEDTTINVVLTPKTKKTLTVNATPDNALIIFTDKPSNVVIAQGTGTLTYETYDPRDILIQVSASGYETYEERITLVRI